MSGTIHINTNQLRQLGTHFITCNKYIREKIIPELEHLSIIAEGEWTGASRLHYDELFHQWNIDAQNLFDSGIAINHYVSTTANKIDHADHSK